MYKVEVKTKKEVGIEDPENLAPIGVLSYIFNGDVARVLDCMVNTDDTYHTVEKLSEATKLSLCRVEKVVKKLEHLKLIVWYEDEKLAFLTGYKLGYKINQENVAVKNLTKFAKEVQPVYYRQVYNMNCW